MPIAKIIGHGDVRIYSIEEIKVFCKKANLQIEKIEKQPKSRLHLVSVKKMF